MALTPIQEEIFRAKMSSTDFTRLSSFITTHFGIKMPPAKKVMLQSRLQKRLRELNIASYKDYIDFLFSKKGMEDELIHMVDVVTTNKTDFFREPNHFEFLTSFVLPEIMNKKSFQYQVKIWSAGCSSGEEPYTLAIVLSEFRDKIPNTDFYILGTDISSRILEKAALSIYPEQRIEGIPMAMKKKYFLRSKNRTKQTVRVNAELRKKVVYKRINFMDHDYDLNETFDIIFCRNVLIYFDRENQERIINKICTKLKPGGYFFLGHSESIMNMNVPLSQIKPTIFRKIVH